MAMGKIAILIDPDKIGLSLSERVTKLSTLELSPDLVLLGGSTGVIDSETVFDQARDLGLPVWLFPGNENQLSPRAKRLLLPILISGRNPQLLIGKHVESARRIKALDIPVTPMGYILIDGGNIPSVQKVSETEPLSPTDIETIVSTAIAGELLGQKAIYLEAGSGAVHPVPPEVIAAVRKEINATLIVGGGLRSRQAIENAFTAGADIVVIGTALEQ